MAVFIFALLGIVLPLSENKNNISIFKYLPNIKLGLDIQGGSSLEYSMAIPEGARAEEIVNNVIAVLRRRLDSAGYTEAVVSEVVVGRKTGR